MTEVVNALREQNATAPVGKRARLAWRTEHPPGRPHRIALGVRPHRVVKRRGDELVRLAQVATVEDGFAELTGLLAAQRPPNVGHGWITRAREASTRVGGRQGAQAVAEINKTLPEGTKLDVTRTAARTPRTA